MAINKNFVVKNGLEVKSNLIVADGDTNKVGIGTTVAGYTLHVIGGIGATDVVVSSALTATTIDAGNITVNGIGVTSLTVSGVSTFTGAIDANGDIDVDGHTELDNLNVSGVSTFVGVATFQGDLYVGGDLYVADDVFYDEVAGRNLNISGIGTIANLIVTTGTVSDLTSASIGSTNINISGVGTIATLDTAVAAIDYGTLVNLDVTGIGSIASLDVPVGTVDYLTSINLETTGITTLSSGGGITTTGGDLYSGGDLYFNGVLYQNGERYGIGIQTGDTLIGSGVTFIEFRGPGVSTGYYSSSTGIATVFFQGGGGGGGGGAIGIGSTFPGTPASIDPSPTNGDLFFHIDYGRTFIYYDEATLGVGSSAFWIDSSPFNIGIITALSGGVAFSDGSALSPSWYFEGDSTTGVFSPTNGELTFVSTGSSVLNVNASGINVTGNANFSGNVSVAGTITYEDVTNVDSIGLGTFRDGLIVNTGTATTALIVNGDARVTGILTIGTSSITLDGNTDTITAAAFYGDGSNLSGVGIGSTGSVNTTGVITATKLVANEFVGSGDNLVFSPTITSFSPSDGATGVSALSSPNIVFTFDQPINVGTGTARLRKDSASGDVVQNFDIQVGTGITLVNRTLTIDPTDNFDYAQDYYLTLDQGIVKNYVEGNSYELTTYNFTTEAGPVLSSVTPTSGSIDVSLSSNIVFTFDKNIRAGSGTITLRTGSASGTIIESYDVTSSARLTFSTNTLTIDPTSTLSPNQNYYVVVPNGAVAGYSGIDTFNFTTENKVFVSSYSPTNGATNIAINTNISLTFDSTPTRGTGTITLRKGSAGGTIIESFDAATSPRISIAGNVWTLDPTSDLPSGPETIYLVIPSGGISPNYDGLNIGGASASYSFNTRSVVVGDAYGGGYLICASGGVRWVVSPPSADVLRTFYSRADANTVAQQVSGCTGWFVPSSYTQLQNPGYVCRTYWGGYCTGTFGCSRYWTNQPASPNRAWTVQFDGPGAGSAVDSNSGSAYRARSFRCVTY